MTRVIHMWPVWLCLGMALACAAPAARGQPAETWQVRQATLRFDVRIRSHPSTPCAGIVALLPDGGILPTATPGTVVVEPEGKVLDCRVLWHNPAEGYGLVFAETEAKSVHVYVGSGLPVEVWTEQSPFCPSLLLYTETRQDGSRAFDLKSARRMARDRPPGRQARLGLVPLIGQQQNLFGADDHYQSYYTGFLKLPNPPRSYVCTISDEGSECDVSGETVASWPGVHRRREGAKGQYGGEARFSGERTRVEYFHFEQTGPQEAHLAWRRPGGNPEQTPKTIPASAYVHSGEAVTTAAAARDGSPVPWISAVAERYVWLGDEPANLFRLRAANADADPAGTRYRWSLPEGGVTESVEFLWLMEGNAPRTVELTATAGGRSATARRTVYWDSVPPAANLDRTADRRLFREALLNHCRAVPSPRDPLAKWGPDLWALLLEVAEPYQGRPLMEQVFERGRAQVLRRPASERHRLEDLYFEILRSGDAQHTLSWLERFRRGERDRARLFEWSLREADFRLYEERDAQRALQVLRSLQAVAPGAGATARNRLLIRRGDVHRALGQVDQARDYYRQAQDLYNEQLAARRPGAGTGARVPPEVRRQRNWRNRAVREAAHYETFKQRLEDGQLLEARKVLEEWALELPLAKVDGTLPLAEARFHARAGDPERAVSILRRYRDAVDMSSDLPEALELELRCLVELKRQDAAVELAELIRDRLPYHPLAERAAELVGREKP